MIVWSATVAFSLFFLPFTFCAPTSFDELLGSLNSISCSTTEEEPRLEFDEVPEDQTVKSGSKLELICAVYSVPQATIEWEFKGQPLKTGPAGSDNFERLENVGTTTIQTAITKSRLTIPCADPATAGEYRCVAKNGCSKQVAKVQVNVEGGTGCPASKKKNSIFRKATPPEITMWTDTRMERFDAAAQLFCRAQGVPQPTIKWYESDEEDQFHPIKAKSDRIVLPNGDLLVKELASGHGSHLFRCVAKNPLGEASEEIMLIEVDLED